MIVTGKKGDWFIQDDFGHIFEKCMEYMTKYLDMADNNRITNEQFKDMTRPIIEQAMSKIQSEINIMKALKVDMPEEIKKRKSEIKMLKDMING